MYAIYVVNQIEVLAFHPTSRCQKMVEYLFGHPGGVFFGLHDHRDEGVMILQYIGICLLNNTL